MVNWNKIYSKYEQMQIPQIGIQIQVCVTRFLLLFTLLYAHAVTETTNTMSTIFFFINYIEMPLGLFNDSIPPFVNNMQLYIHQNN